MTAVKTSSEDRRWPMVDTRMRRLGYKTHALIEALHGVQESYGFIDQQQMRQVAKALRVPLSKVYGVATFYHFFTLKPQGRHTCVVCTGTACYIKGAGVLLDQVEQRYGLQPGQTTNDGQLSVVTARCLGACGLAPAVVLDGEVTGNLGATQIIDKLQERLRHDA